MTEAVDPLGHANCVALLLERNFRGVISNYFRLLDVDFYWFALGRLASWIINEEL